jgi:hypothetical protein
MLAVSGIMMPETANIYLILVDISAHLGWSYWLRAAAPGPSGGIR